VPLFAAGLGDALSRPGTSMFCVFEKGAVWAPVTADGLGDIVIDEAVALPKPVVDEARELVASEFSATMFFDETKHAMISVEQRTDVSHETYLPTQQRSNATVWACVSATERLRMPRGRCRSVSTRPSSQPTSNRCCSTKTAGPSARSSISPRVDRCRSCGARWATRAATISWLTTSTLPGTTWRPAPYDIITEGELIHDEAGAAFLEYWVTKLGLR
jgi:hypothetical protein